MKGQEMTEQQGKQQKNTGSELLYIHSLLVQWSTGAITHDEFLDHMFSWAQDHEEQKKTRTHQVKTGSRSRQKKVA